MEITKNFIEDVIGVLKGFVEADEDRDLFTYICAIALIPIACILMAVAYIWVAISVKIKEKEEREAKRIARRERYYSL